MGLAASCLPHPACGSNPLGVAVHVVVDHKSPHFVLAGAAIGALVDASMKKTFHLAPGSKRLSVAPMVSRDAMGARMSVGW